jgi:NAD(P)-dependent dehydrogenase (short-subunit alcohol dehydrogenase family)
MGVLTGKKILVAGGSSGIGKEIAKIAITEGATLLLVSSNEQKLNLAAIELSSFGPVSTFAIDLSQPDWDSVYKDEILKYGPFDGLVYAVGISPTKPFRVLKPLDWNQLFQINLFASIQLTQLALGATSVNSTFSGVYISSVLSEVGDKGKSLYSMSKAALVSMVKCLTLEYAKKNFRFNTISPGVVETPLSAKSVYRENEESLQKMEIKHPLGFGNVSDVAEAAVYLLSDKSKWVSGTNMIVDGGYLAQ